MRSADNQGEKAGESLAFEEPRRAENVAESQQQLIKQAEELKRSIEALRKSAEAAGVGDSAWQRELSDIRDQIDRALTPELRERLRRSSRRSRTSTPIEPRTRWSGWPRPSAGSGKRSSGVASCSAAPPSRAIWPI